MSHTPKVLLLLAIVALGASLLLLSRSHRPVLPQLGMSDAPCAAFNRTSERARRTYDWAGLCIFAADNERLKKAGVRPRLVMIGDSLTANWKLSEPGIVQRGIGGQTSAQVLVRFRQHAVALKPQMVHILVGTNDIAGNTGPSTPDRIMANIASMVEIARANGITPILATLPPAHDFAWASDSPPNPWIDRLNAEIETFANAEGIVLSDYHAVLATRSGALVPSLFEDGAHPNDTGFAKMKTVLDAAIAKAESRGTN